MAQVTRRQLLVLREWDRWCASQGNGIQPTRRDTLQFFVELQTTKPDLLNFNPRGRDKWEIVHRWLVAAGRVQNGEPNHSDA